jgi:hypothetical protein
MFGNASIENDMHCDYWFWHLHDTDFPLPLQRTAFSLIQQKQEKHYNKGHNGVAGHTRIPETLKPFLSKLLIKEQIWITLKPLNLMYTD